MDSVIIPDGLVGKARIKYIDAIRAFAILMVVMEHVMNMGFGIVDMPINTIFFTFRMPLFFFISGFIAYKSKDKWSQVFYKNLMLKKARIQLIPCVVFFFLYNIVFGNNPLEEFLVYGFGSYWFTFVLFEMFIVYFTISLIGSIYNKDEIVNYVLIFISIACFLVFPLLHEDTRFTNISCIKLLNFPFFIFGILSKKHENIFFKLIEKNSFRTVIIVGYIFFLLLNFNDRIEEYNHLLYAAVHWVFVRIFGLLFIFISFWYYREVFNRETVFNKIFLFVGRRTLDIYLLHFFLIPSVDNILSLNTPYAFTIQLLIGLILSIIIICICLILSNLIRTSDTLAYWLFGAKKIK